MIPRAVEDESTLLRAAATGDRHAFDRLVAPHMATLRAFVHRMIGHPDDAADLVQESLLRAFNGLGGFREGARFSTWLCSIAAHASIDHLRKETRWRPYAQSYAEQECAGSPEMRQEILNVLAAPEFSFDVHEHIAACFTCVARSLPALEEAAIVLVEIFEYSNQEAADVLGVSESVLRHHLARARASMKDSYEGLCALVNKQGICHQCAGFRNATHEGAKGPVVEPLGARSDDAEGRFRVRLAIVRDKPFVGGKSATLHDLLFERIRSLERRTRANRDAHPVEAERATEADDPRC